MVWTQGDSDWRLDSMWGSHLHSQSELYHVSYLIELWLLTWAQLFERRLKLTWG